MNHEVALCYGQSTPCVVTKIIGTLWRTGKTMMCVFYVLWFPKGQKSSLYPYHEPQ